MPYTKSQKDFALDLLKAARSHIGSSTVPKSPYNLRFFASKLLAFAVLDDAIAEVEAETAVADGTTFIIEYRAKFSADSNDYRRSRQFGGVYETYNEAAAVIKG